MRRVPLALGVLIWPALASSSLPEPVPPPQPPPVPRWEVTEWQLPWPAAAAPVNAWGCPGRGARLQVDRLKVLRNAERLRERRLRPGAGPKPVPPVDTVRVWFSFFNAGPEECVAPQPRMYRDPGLTRTAWTHEGSPPPVLPRRTRQVLAEGEVPLGTRAVWVSAPGSPLRLGIDLGTGTAALLSPEGTVQASASGRRSVAVPAVPPSYDRIPVGERFPGASLVQPSGGRCSRFFDLGVDDVYLVRGVERKGDVFDELVLDATFYREQDEPRTNPECQRREYEAQDYAVLLLPSGLSQAGSTVEAEATVAGGREVRRFQLPPGTGQVTLGFGDPTAPADAVTIDLELHAVRVVRRSPSPTFAGSRDLSREWMDRERDPKGYLLEKFGRGLYTRTAPENPCGALRWRMGKAYVPEGDAEVIRETFKVLCGPDWDAGRP